MKSGLRLDAIAANLVVVAGKGMHDMPRAAALQSFADAALAAFGEAATAPESRTSLRHIAEALSSPAPRRERPGRRLPACEHLAAALDNAAAKPSLAGLVDAFRAIEPDLEWTRRESTDGTASANFTDAHANTMIFGPAGLENRRDIWIGASLMAPHVRYPDHDHAPEETYLVLSDSEFRHGDDTWFRPGIGGSFYNTPFIGHAMRSGETPLFAFWALWVDPNR